MKYFRGWIGEQKTKFYLWLSLRNKAYCKFNNIILPSTNGTTQIDHLIVSVFGLFIVETKNKKGWIFGSDQQDFWTQIIYAKKYTFQNPLRQVYRQKKILSEFLNIDEPKIHTVIYFAGNCKFKTPLPDNVIKSGVSRYIKRFRHPLLSTEEVDRIVISIKKHLSESSFSNSDHIRSLRNRYASNTICPKCGSNLILRTAQKGPNTGKQFLGCENYPKCLFTKSV